MQVVPLLADLRQAAVEFAGALVAYAAGLEAQVRASMALPQQVSSSGLTLDGFVQRRLC